MTWSETTACPAVGNVTQEARSEPMDIMQAGAHTVAPALEKRKRFVVRLTSKKTGGKPLKSVSEIRDQGGFKGLGELQTWKLIGYSPISLYKLLVLLEVKFSLLKDFLLHKGLWWQYFYSLSSRD